MDVKEVSIMLDIINTAYPQFVRQLTDSERRAQVKIWSTMLAKDDSHVVSSVLYQHIATCKYPPTIAEIRDGIRKRTQPKPEDLFAVLKKHGNASFAYTTELVDKGGAGVAATYRQVSHKQQAFDSMPLILRTYVKTPDSLQDWYKRYKADPAKVEQSFYQDIKAMLVSEDLRQLQIGGE